MLPPDGLARAILQCFVTAWDSQSNALFGNYCWQDPTPWFIGEYPNTRQVHFRIFHAVNGICSVPPQGTPVYEAFVTISRRLYYPPLPPPPPPPPPMLRDGFE